MKLLDAATMRELDRATLEDVGIPGIVLMETAGRAVSDRAEALLLAAGVTRAVVLCGPGNNGGDGFVVARHLADRGVRTAAVLLADPAALRGDAALAFRPLAAFPVEVLACAGALPPDLAARMDGAAVIDAVFGTGLARPVEGLAAEAVALAGRTAGPRVAVDLPTGVDADSGRILGAAFRADLTVALGAAKVGHAAHPGAAFCGRVEVVPIGIPAAAIEAAPGAWRLESQDAARAFAPRDPAAHKNRFGHLLVAGGLPGKSGAVLLAARAAVRCGAGLVTIAAGRESAARLEGLQAEVMVEGPLALRDGWVVCDGLDLLLAGKSAAVVGPGLSTLPGALQVVEAVLDAGLPTVLDADALNLLAANPGAGRPSGAPRVLTPHPGEAARLLGTTGAEVQADRVAAARALATSHHAIAVLKGAGTVVASPDGRLAINGTGGPALATAGTGDVLAGMIGALLARGVRAWDAACAAVHLHGLAGERAGRRLTEHATGASDVVDELPAALREVLQASAAAADGGPAA